MPRTNNKTLTAKQTAAAAAVTIPNAGPARRLRLDLVAASVSAGVAALTIADVDGVFWEDLVVAGQPYVLPLGTCDGMQSRKAGSDLTVTLASAGAGNVGRVNVVYHSE